MIPLMLAREGERVKISRVSGGQSFIRRMMDLGLRQGMEIEIISASGNGTLVIRIDGQRLGVGLGIARKIFVELLS